MCLERTLTTEHKWRLDSLRTYEVWEVENQADISKKRNPAASEGGRTRSKGRGR